MTKLDESAKNHACESERAARDTSPAQVASQEADGKQEASTSPMAGKLAHAWDQRHKTWRALTSIVSSARRQDEEPPFSDD